MTKGTYTYEYPRPSVTTDCVIFGFDSDGLAVLLIERGIEIYEYTPGFVHAKTFISDDKKAVVGTILVVKKVWVKNIVEEM